MQVLSIQEVEDVSGGISFGGFLRDWIIGHLLDAAVGAVVDYNNSGQASQDQMGSGAGVYG